MQLFITTLRRTVLKFHHTFIMKLKFFSGKASIARRSRQADGCDAVEELEPINQNLQIDFKFQVN